MTGCPMGYCPKGDLSPDERQAHAAVDAMLFSQLEQPANNAMDDCRARVGAASQFVKGLWALGVSHELLPHGVGHCSAEAGGSRLAAQRGAAAKAAVAAQCEQPGLGARLAQCKGKQQCIVSELESFASCAAGVVAAAAAAGGTGAGAAAATVPQ